MLEKILTAVTDLPVIIQGAIGSGLFALVYFLGQKLYALGRDLITKQNKSRRRRYLTEEIAKYNIATADNYAKSNAFTTMLIYRAMRSLFKALLLLSLGLLFGSVGFVFGAIGYLGAIYFLFQGLNTVRAATKTEDKKQRLNELRDELESLKQTDLTPHSSGTPNGAP